MIYSTRPRFSKALPIGLALLAIAAATLAQPTGNPKGTAAPISQDMSKSPAGGGGSNAAAAASGGADSGKLDMGPASARLAPSREAGTGTAGGLPKRNVGDGMPSSATKADSTTVPTRQPTSPAR